jgi:hypothetical protein
VTEKSISLAVVVAQLCAVLCEFQYDGWDIVAVGIGKSFIMRSPKYRESLFYRQDEAG